ncbi:MAG: response regulator [Acidobacteria bacterium]|nr:response regulator [Acidobacteriota bacterium]
MLLIDDDELISRALYDELLVQGCKVDLALSAEEGERALGQREYAIVLVDAYLTGQLNERAFGLLDRVLELRRGAYVLLVTAYRAGALQERLRAVPSLTIVDKPLPVWMLIELVTGFLSIRQTRTTAGSNG